MLCPAPACTRLVQGFEQGKFGLESIDQFAETGIALVADMLANPKFDSSAVEEVRKAIEENGYNEKRGVFVQAFDRMEMDAGLLLLPTTGLVDFNDERMIRTTDAVRADPPATRPRGHALDDARCGSDGGGLAQHRAPNLAGATISEKWSEARKQEIRASRVNTGKAIVEAVKAAEKKPRVVVQSSAVGYYGPRGAEEIMAWYDADPSRQVVDPAFDQLEDTLISRVEQAYP